MPVLRARVSQTGKISSSTTQISRALGTVHSSLGVGGRGCEIFASATCLLHFTKASTAAQSQQEKNDTADMGRTRRQAVRGILLNPPVL